MEWEVDAEGIESSSATYKYTRPQVWPAAEMDILK
jgi:hypothetical protein